MLESSTSSELEPELVALTGGHVASQSRPLDEPAKVGSLGDFLPGCHKKGSERIELSTQSMLHLASELRLPTCEAFRAESFKQSACHIVLSRIFAIMSKRSGHSVLPCRKISGIIAISLFCSN